jgi:hypothetical protein
MKNCAFSFASISDTQQYPVSPLYVGVSPPGFRRKSLSLPREIVKYVTILKYREKFQILREILSGFNLQNGHFQTSSATNPNTQRSQNKATDVVNRHYSRKLLKMNILMFETC